ncbi:MAG: hypothetical protein WCG45_04745 [bacterium]
MKKRNLFYVFLSDVKKEKFQNFLKEEKISSEPVAPREVKLKTGKKNFETLRLNIFPPSNPVIIEHLREKCKKMNLELFH